MPGRRGRRDSKLELLRQVPLFSACSQRELKQIAALADVLQVGQGTVLARQGEEGKQCFVVVRGTAKVGIRGRRSISVGPGACLGEMSLLDGEPRTATITAESDLEVLVLDRRGFSSLIGEVPSVARKLMQALATRLRAAERSPTH